MTIDKQDIVKVGAAEDIATRPAQAEHEEVRNLARSYIALLDAVRTYGPCVACDNDGCTAMRKILDAADKE